MERPANQDQHFSKAKILFWLSLALIQIDYVQDPLVKCKVEFNDKCNTTLSWTTQVKYTDKQGPFTVAYTTTEETNENALLLPYLGQCEVVGEDTCDEGNNMLVIRFKKITENDKEHNAHQEGKVETEKEIFLAENGKLELWMCKAEDKLELLRYPLAATAKTRRGPRLHG